MQAKQPYVKQTNKFKNQTKQAKKTSDQFLLAKSNKNHRTMKKANDFPRPVLSTASESTALTAVTSATLLGNTVREVEKDGKGTEE